VRDLQTFYVKQIEPVQPDFGIRIKKLRLDRDMTQQDLANLCELSVDQIQKIENGKSWTTDLSFALLADALKVSNDSLLDFSGNAAFIKNGGNTRRASRKRGALTVRRRKVDVPISRSTRRTPRKKE
jgi:transcriptional regulator with XRE-family HTH domain